MGTTTLLIPFPHPGGPPASSPSGSLESRASTGGWSIARVVVEAAEAMLFVQSLAAFGVNYYPAGDDPGIVTLVRPEGDWQTAARAFLESHRGSLEIVAHADFQASWRMPDHAIEVVAGLDVVSSWSGRPASPSTILLDPGLAFGDCNHPTTRMCAAAIAKRMRELPFASLLDVGCGSGILALCAARVGASHVTATDLDPYSRFITARNAARNGLAVVVADDFPSGRFDVVVANIWATAFPALASTLEGALSESGILVLSGFRAEDGDAVAALFPDFVDTRVTEEMWSALVLQRAMPRPT